MRNKGVPASWDLSPASFAWGAVHQKSQMPSLNYLNVDCCTCEWRILSKADADRKLFFFIGSAAQRCSSLARGPDRLTGYRTSMPYLSGGHPADSCRGLRMMFPMKDELLVPRFWGGGGGVLWRSYTKYIKEYIKFHQRPCPCGYQC